MTDFITLILSIIIGTLTYKKVSVPFRFVTLLLFVILLSESLAYLSIILFKNNLIVYSIASIIIPVFFFLVYIQMIETKKKTNYYLSFSLLYLFIIINTIYIQREEPLPTYNQQATCLYFIILSVFQYNQILQKNVDLPLGRNSIFWLNTVLFIYFSGTFVPWAVFNMFLKMETDFDSIIMWNYYLTIFLYIGLTLSLLLNAYGKPSTTE